MKITEVRFSAAIGETEFDVVCYLTLGDKDSAANIELFKYPYDERGRYPLRKRVAWDDVPTELRTRIKELLQAVGADTTTATVAAEIFPVKDGETIRSTKVPVVWPFDPMDGWNTLLHVPTKNWLASLRAAIDGWTEEQKEAVLAVAFEKTKEEIQRNGGAASEFRDIYDELGGLSEVLDEFIPG